MSYRDPEAGLADLPDLAALLRSKGDLVLSGWRRKVRELPSAKHLDQPTLNDHFPLLLDELASALHDMSGRTIAESVLHGSPPAHGIQRWEDDFDIVEVVAEYNILRGCIQEVAEGNGIVLRGLAFHILNRVFDEAIGVAVQAFAKQQAFEVQRRRDEYLAFVAHDLRTPLNAIALASQVLEVTLAKRVAGMDVSRALRSLRRNVAQLETHVANILKESVHVRTTDGIKLERRCLDLWPLVEAMIHDLQPVADTAGARLVNDVPDDLVAYADASLVRRILENLVANAIRYTPRGRVLVGAQSISESGAIEAWVVDNGAGIPAGRLGLVFDKRETDPEVSGGTGLGLAIVKAFVEAHGGEVGVESEEGAGSTFRFTLPGPAAIGC